MRDYEKSMLRLHFGKFPWGVTGSWLRSGDSHRKEQGRGLELQESVSECRRGGRLQNTSREEVGKVC